MLNSSRVYLDRFAAEAASSIPRGSIVLDAGCGSAPYRKHLLDAGHRYESADFASVPGAGYADLTYTCRLEAIPVEAGRYDLVLLSQVLEHLPDPLAVLREMHRILKPGGSLWLSAPLYYEEHQQPYDFYRYTQFGFRHLLESSGFAIDRMEWMEGYFGTLSYQLELASRSLPSGAAAYGGGAKGRVAATMASGLRPTFRRLSSVFAGLDLRAKHTGSGHPKNYAIVARKSASL